jgi:hypothetical protein
MIEVPLTRIPREPGPVIPYAGTARGWSGNIYSYFNY